VSFARVVLALSALPFAGIGVAFLVAPVALAAHVDLSLGSATADHDVRAVYGGLQLGCATLLAWGAAQPERVRFALVAQLLLYGGLAAARGVAWSVAGPPGPFGAALHVGETFGFLAAWLALRRLGSA
jgi:hypothetical protein